MTARAYYNEFDPGAAAWLRELVYAGLIAPGDVDERDIREVRASDLAGYTQVHFFAGIGGWSYALRQAGWSDERSVWTGSCPCQALSNAGKRGMRVEDWTDLRAANANKIADDRHLWPAFHRLVTECKPAIVFGEQVANADGRTWLTAVRADLEAVGYAVGASDLCAAGVGAPHIRQRLWWGAVRVAHAESKRWATGRAGEPSHVRQVASGGSRSDGGLADTHEAGRGELGGCELQHSVGTPHGHDADGRGEVRGGGLGNTSVARLEGRFIGSTSTRGRNQAPGPTAETGAPDWSDLEWLWCRDGKFRPTQPGLFPLADGIPSRVGRLRGYGNAIVPELAATFIEAFAGSVEDLERGRACG